MFVAEITLLTTFPDLSLLHAIFFLEEIGLFLEIHSLRGNISQLTMLTHILKRFVGAKALLRVNLEHSK